MNENEEKEFISMFFVYKLGDEFPDHVGAEKEALKWINSLFKKREDELVKKIKEMEQPRCRCMCEKSNNAHHYNKALMDALALIKEDI